VSKVHLEVTMMKRIGELNAENARLKAEVERLRSQVERLTDAITSGNAITPDAREVQP